jgi:hypothetical protein
MVAPGPKPPMRPPAPKPRHPTLVGVAPPNAGLNKPRQGSAPDLAAQGSRFGSGQIVGGAAAAGNSVAGAAAEGAELVNPATVPTTMAAAPFSGPSSAGIGTPVSIPAFTFGRGLDDDDEQTVVSQVPSEILGQLAGDRITGRPGLVIEDEASEWKRVFDDFVKLKKECGEPIDGISFDKFKNTLRKNRDQLLQRHGCKSVKFSVYVKQGKAALKANPVRT